MRIMRARVLVLALTAAGCTADIGTDTDSTGGASETQRLGDRSSDSSAIEHGRKIWFENTYGGQKFFAILAQLPPPRGIRIAFEELVTTPRSERFAQWGVINDPDCHANPAGGLDICPDPTATGVVGIRVFPGPGGSRLYGIACASCHAGFDPLKPPADPAEPKWANIHPTIGNQYAKFSRIFSDGLAADDVRRFMFTSWPDGAVDTTALFPDNIMNPGVVTAFWNHPYRPTFDVGMDEAKMRNGQGGEDDVGGDLAALRVYTNIGVCFQECVAGPMQAGQPIDIATCYASCPDFPPQSDLDDLTAFLGSIKSPLYPARPKAPLVYAAGRAVFDHTCAGCHDDHGARKKILTNDEVNPLADDALNATNACRALSTNWQEGRLWAQFSSQVYKDRVAAGDRGYRTMPLTGIWATAPFMHNQSIGARADASAGPDERVGAYWDAMWELLSTDREPITYVLPVAVGPFPAGTPLHYLFSRDPATGQILCTDLVENHGHYYGSDLSVLEKLALIYWLQFQ